VAAGTIDAMLRGRLLTEGLRVGAELVVDDLRVTRLTRQDESASGRAAGTPEHQLDWEG